jgi:hypothetical protein
MLLGLSQFDKNELLASLLIFAWSICRSLPRVSARELWLSLTKPEDLERLSPGAPAPADD